MKRILFFIISILCVAQYTLAQTPATFSVPISIGRNNCGSGGSTNQDSVYFFNYVNRNMTRAAFPNAYKPRLKVGPTSTTDRWSIFAATISFNPKDQKIYYLWTDYFHVIRPAGSASGGYWTYIWRWRPDTTFTVGGTVTANFVDTVRSFPYDIGGVAFDNDGVGWTLEFPGTMPATRAFLRPIDFVANIYNPADTMDFVPSTGLGSTLYNVNSGDMTMMPSGQIYYNFNNKLYTPDYASYGGPTRHIKSTFIDTTRLPAGATGLVGLGYGDGELIASYSTGCRYRVLNPVTGDTAAMGYTYAASKGVYSVDMTQITSGVGSSKRLVSVTPTGTPNQYDVVYDVFVRNYGTTPVTNVQVSDNLGLINGIFNVSNVTATLTSNPAGVTLNPLYNGVLFTNLLAGSQTVPNFPASNNNFTIRISCRLSNIQQGVVYNNQAIATANGFNNTALRDSSTNGSVPDLNQNDKPDDAGESQPTPFVVVLTPITPPCATFSQTLYNQDFGNGAGMYNTIPPSVAVPSASTTYTGVLTTPIPINRFTVTPNAINGDASNWVSLTDHTGGVNGRMLLINADAAAGVAYRDTLPVVCPGQQYSVSFWAAFVGNNSYRTVCDGLGGFKYSQLLVRVRDRVTGLVITQYTTDTIQLTSWRQHGMRWVMPAGYSQVILELINAAPGGCGNDFALDDIRFGICDPAPTVSLSNPGGTCLGSAVTFNSALTDGSFVPGTKDYQWQVGPSATGPWTNITGATSDTYTINPVNPSDTGRYYRVIVAAQGNIGNATCQYYSAATLLSGRAPSFAASSANRNKNNVCPGVTVQLSLTGGTLGTAATWRWYTGSPGGTLIGSGATLNVNPAATTTYYVRAEGSCNTTSDVSVTVTVNCDIDKDNDGIPDFVESNMAAAFADANGNMVINAYDPTFAGFVDNNNDFVNDNFQADGDSDNDGIPNYLDATFAGRVDANSDGIDDRFDQDRDGIINMLDLDSDNDGVPDVVEAWGVDTNGDGRIDNLTDTDGDGLSDNVDSRVIVADGAYNTGVGLDLINIDGDALPNFLDLDSDNDGIPDIREVLGTDADNDGKADAFTDVNGDGLHDAYITAGALLLTGADAGGDGRADSWPNKNLDRDLRPNAYDLDSDGDGIADVIEAGGGILDADLNGLADGVLVNGWSSTVDALPALNLRNTEGVGNPDYLDIDSDEDGIPDNIEGMSTAGYQLPTTTDADGDGLCTPYDNLVGFGGSGIFVYDHDGDGTPDYRDLDTDADGALDMCEGNDWTLDGVCNEPLVLTGMDTDGDGLDNLYDSLNSVTNLKGTSYMLGSGGTFTGDATPGTRATVQRTFITQSDRDWRWAATVLPVQYLGFTGAMQNAQVNLSWTIVTAKAIDRFEIERSTDNSNFTKVGTVTDAVQLNIQQVFGLTDDVANVNSDVFYYRLKAISKTGEFKYSNVLVVRRNSSKTLVTVMPNPANDYATVRFFVEKESEVTIRLLDNVGKTVMLQKQKAAKGTNAVQLNNLAKYSNGVYSVQVLVNGEVVTQKILLSH